MNPAARHRCGLGGAFVAAAFGAMSLIACLAGIAVALSRH
jgi:hypothetical protein